MPHFGRDQWPDGFARFYDSRIGPLQADMATAETDAMATSRQRHLLFWPIAVAGGGALGFFLGTGGLFAAAALGILIFQGWVRAPWRAFNQRFRKVVLEEICGFMGLRLLGTPARLNLQPYRQFGLLPGYDRRKAEDQLSGSHGGFAFELTEVHLEQRHRTKDRTYYTTVFRGPVIRLDGGVAFSGTTIVRADRTVLGNWLTGLFSDKDRVRLEDPEFERQFEVYGDDQVEARVLLNPGLMERLKQLRLDMGGKVNLAFNGRSIWITANNSWDLFEAKKGMAAQLLEQRVGQLLFELTIVHRIIDGLDLDDYAAGT